MHICVRFTLAKGASVSPQIESNGYNDLNFQKRTQSYEALTRFNIMLNCSSVCSLKLLMVYFRIEGKSDIFNEICPLCVCRHAQITDIRYRLLMFNLWV